MDCGSVSIDMNLLPKRQLMKPQAITGAGRVSVSLYYPPALPPDIQPSLEEVNVEAEELIDTVQHFQSGSGIVAVVAYQPSHH